MEHVFSCAFASAFILQEKKFVAKKKLFVARTFLLALCRRPYPSPSWHCGYCQHGRRRTGRRPSASARMPHAGAIMATPAGWWPWVIWVIWVMVLNCMAMHDLGSFGSLFFDSPNDPKGADLAPRGIPGFGSFGSFCHRIKIGAGSGVREACMVY
jgi:hypothetical protein